MLDINTMVADLAVILATENDDKLYVLCNKAKDEMLYMLEKTEDEIEDKFIPMLTSLIEDMAAYKFNTLPVLGIQSEKVDVITTTYASSSTYPQDLQQRINNLVQKINPNGANNTTDYATISSPFLP